ncbi:MAG TPA: glycosyltransferase family 4 protein, partial [Acidobacteriota bacterium]|nr:glycosyltransferase family 4 protein [Acidobacteriota bacterium]
MRVIHIDTGKDWRGGQSQVLMLAEGLKERGHDVILAARKGGALAERARQHHLECHEVPFRFEVDPVSAITLSRLAATEGASALFHSHTPHALSLAILAQKLGRPRPILFTRRVAFPIKKLFINRWKINRADRIVAVSAAVCAELVNAGIPAKKIRIIYSAIDSRIYTYHGPNLESPLNIVIAGAVEPAKGIEDAMRCVELSGDLPVRFH